MALVNVDYVSPSLWLGVAVAMSGLVLYAFKMQNAKGTEDLDIVTSSLLVLVGGILMLQGWRLDPILMLSEAVLASVGVYYIIQTVELRKQIGVRPLLPTVSAACFQPSLPKLAFNLPSSTLLIQQHVA